jgi:hypothetical protein
MTDYLHNDECKTHMLSAVTGYPSAAITAACGSISSDEINKFDGWRKIAVLKHYIGTLLITTQTGDDSTIAMLRQVEEEVSAKLLSMVVPHE